MWRYAVSGLIWFSLLLIVSANDNGFSECNCDDEDALRSIENILDCQRVSDVFIAVAYFSIPIELLYFVTCSNFLFKWDFHLKCVLIEFIAFIVLCGLTHLLNVWTYGPHPYVLMFALTVFKGFTALVSCITAISLYSFIPKLLIAKYRVERLTEKNRNLGREVGIIRKQNDAGLHVRMLTQEIRKSLDRHMILYTTLVELSKTLGLQNCAVWMPNEIRTDMILTHALNDGNYSSLDTSSIPITDPDVVRIERSEVVNILSPDSALAKGSCRDSGEPGPVAAIRMPMLRVCNFKGGTPEMVQACYAILVLVLPGEDTTAWTSQELEIIKVVADQVAVALSHAAVLEESQYMREKLEEQNRALQQAKMNAMMASQARVAFQKVMSDGMKRPMHSILGLISMMQDGNLKFEQRILLDTMMKTSNVLSMLINDVMEISTKDSGRFPLEIKPFHLQSAIKEVACLAKCLCVYSGFGFSHEVDKCIPDNVMGDERRLFQVILHMVGNLLDGKKRKGSVLLRVLVENGSQERSDHKWAAWKHNALDGDVHIRFEIILQNDASESEGSSSVSLVGDQINQYINDGIEESLSFSVCKKLVQLMHGNIWVVPDSQGAPQSMGLILWFQPRLSISRAISESGESSDHPHSNTLFRGLQVLLVDADDVNRAVTRKLLEKLGCCVATVSSAFICLSALGPSTPFQIVLLDLQMPELDGFEIASRIRKFRSRSWPLIIALTASADEDLWEKCLQSGMNGIIQKPVMLKGIANELLRVVVQANKVLV